MKPFKLIALLLFPILSFSQELFTQNEIVINEGLKTKQGKYFKMSDYVIRYSDATPEELYDKTVLWFNDNFKGEGEEIVEGKNDIKTQLKFFNDLVINLNQYLNGDQDIDDEDW